jgi:hypothetical protein
LWLRFLSIALIALILPKIPAVKKRLAVIAGILGPLTVVPLTVIGGANFPGYSHASDFISELGSTDAPHGRLVSWAGFFPAGIFTRPLPRSAAGTLGCLGLLFFPAGYLAAAFFPCEGDCRSAHPGFSQAMHNFFGLAGLPDCAAQFVGAGRGRVFCRPWDGWAV